MNEVIKKAILEKYPLEENPYVEYLMGELKFEELEVKRLQDLIMKDLATIDAENTKLKEILNKLSDKLLAMEAGGKIYILPFLAVLGVWKIVDTVMWIYENLTFS